MPSFENITIVNIDGRTGDLSSTCLALQHSYAQMPGASCLLISPERPAGLSPDIEHVSIVPMGWLEYSLFVTFVLHQFIKTDFALIIQNDGWVLNGNAFREEFLEFDYIGAPSGHSQIIMEGKTEDIKYFDWTSHYFSQKTGKVNFHMNGGFSLRSQRFLKAPAELGLDYRFRAPEIIRHKNDDYVRRMNWNNGDAWEDYYHCVTNRSVMEAAGLRFAPVCIARHFSFEHYNPYVHRGIDLSQSFGHHASMRRLLSLEPLTVGYLWKECEVMGIKYESEILTAFRECGYNVLFEEQMEAAGY